MIKAISNSSSNPKSAQVSFSKQSRAVELPCAKKMNTMSNDKFRKKGVTCGVDLSFEDD